ncbi:Uncharacterised protein [Pseudomonas aeruginosa]|nr:Uncharacterised protein [Pseudomonas aeruginosa]
MGGFVLFLRPDAEADHVPLQAGDRVAQREVGPVVGGAVLGRVVRSRVRAGAVGDPFDQARPEVAPGALGGPLGGGVDRQEVIAVDPQRSDPAAHATVGEGGAFAAGDGLEGGDRPLVVDHVEDYRRAVDMGEGEGGVEVRLGGGAVADPGRGDARVALDRRGHAPADRLDELGGEVAGDGEETGLLARVHDRQLAALERIGLVGEKLADHVHQRVFAGDQDALLAIGREAHVAVAQGQGMGGGDGFLAEALHIEGKLFLPLRGEHARVEQTGLEHRPHAAQQLFVAELRVPGTDGVAVVVEHAYQAVGQVAGLGGLDIHRRLAYLAGGGQVQIGKVGLAARTPGGLRDMQTQRLVITHDRPPARSGPNGWRDQKRANGARSGGLGGWRVPVLWVGAGCRRAGYGRRGGTG